MAEIVIPEGTTHFTEFRVYGSDYIFYKATYYKYYNSVIDHPTECWQDRVRWDYFEHGKWVDVGSGWSARRCLPIAHFEEYDRKLQHESA